MRTRRLGAATAVAVAWSAAGPALAAVRSDLRLRVLDPSDAVVARAAAVVRCPGERPRQVETNGRGLAGLGAVDPSTCTLHVEARGFEPAESEIAPDVEGLVSVHLALVHREEKVTVGDASPDALARERSFTEVLTPEEIASLPDDPEEMENALRQRAGPGAVLRVNGFTGGRLPPKSQIRQIRIQTNRFAAEYHEGGHPGIDIVTRPGLGGWRTAAGGSVRGGAWASQPPLASTGSAQGAHRLSLTLDGPLRKEKTSLALQLQSRAITDAVAVTALVPGAPPIVRPTQAKLDLQGRLEHAWGRTQTARMEVQHNTYDRDLLGAGGLALPDRAYADDRVEDLLRLSNMGVTRGAWATDTRLQLRREGIDWTPRTSGPAVDVLGAFSAGGAPLDGGRTSWDLELGQDLSRGIGRRNSVRAGLLYQGGRLRGDERRNALGTYTFASQADWEAGRPQLFAQRTGDPRVEVDLHRLGLYAQDDWRPTEALAVNAGVRYEAQTLIAGAFRVAPRVGLTWALRPNLTVRAGGGRFFEWLDADTVAQVRAGDGSRTHDVSVEDPGWPDPFSSGALRAATPRRWALAPTLAQPEAWRFSFGLERSLFAGSRLNLEYSYEQGAFALRARNLPEGRGRLFEVRSEGRLRGHTLRADTMLGGPGRRAGAMVGYMLHYGQSDTDGPLALTADESNLAAEWGPARDDIRHRVFGFFHWRIAGRLRTSGQVFAQSGAPWDAITGRDDNGDTVASDRPVGAHRNAERGAWTIDMGLRLAWDFGFGGPRTAGPRGPQMVAIRLGGDDAPPDLGGGPDEQRYGVQLYATVANALDRLNATRYGNVVGSSLFRQPVEAALPRRVEVGMTFKF